MRCRKPRSILPLARLILLSALFGARFEGVATGQAPPGDGEWARQSRLVRVRITSETPPSAEAVIVNGRQLQGYQPKIIQAFPSTGVVIDKKGNVLTYVGYRWVDLPSRNLSVEIVTERGQSLRGKLIGIDEGAGVAVVSLSEGHLEETPICADCRVRDGAFLVAPVFDREDFPRYERIEILSYIPEPELPGRREWELRADSLPQIGEPLMDSKRRVLGFVSDRRLSMNDSAGFWAKIFPISQMLGSAEKILRAGGNIRTGWLGIYLGDALRGSAASVVVNQVEEGSPAQRAGLAAGDALVKWNGKQIRDAKHLVQTIQETEIGSTVALEIDRQGRQMTVRPVIEARRYGTAMHRFVFSYMDVVTLQGTGMAPPPGSWGGMTAIPLTQAVADGLQIPGERGLLILNVEPSTPFSRAGLMGGDVILAADDSRIGDLKDLYSYARSRARQGRMVLRLFRRGSERNAIVQLPIAEPADGQK
jgi:S1-C subfamily serine protease